jgi:phosphate-selective porin OprO/OprP
MRIFGAAILSALLILGFGFGPQGYAEPVPAGSLEDRIRLLEKELALLKRQVEVDHEVSFNKAQKDPIITASTGKEGFSIKSPDSNFRLKVGGYGQADGRYFVNDQEMPGTTTQFLLRKARLTFDGTVYKYFDFRLMPDFGQGTTVLQDAYFELNRWNWIKPRIGKFKEPFGLERLQSDVNNTFIELGLPSNLVPNRDIGAQIAGDFWDGALSYQLGIFNGVPDGGSSDSDINNNKDVAARVFTEPFKNSDNEILSGLGAGFATTYGHQETTLPSYRSPAQATIFGYQSGTTINGQVVRISPQAYYYYGPFGALTEYVLSQQEIEKQPRHDTLKNSAWQILLSYVLTGEKASYNGVKPLRPFLKDGGIGAFEVATRVGSLNVDQQAFELGFAGPSSIRQALEWGLALNWYLNNNVKWALNLEHTKFYGGGVTSGTAIGGPDRESENAVLSRVQLAF